METKITLVIEEWMMARFAVVFGDARRKEISRPELGGGDPKILTPDETQFFRDIYEGKITNGNDTSTGN